MKNETEPAENGALKLSFVNNILLGIVLPASIGFFLVLFIFLYLPFGDFKVLGFFLLAYIFPPMGQYVIPAAIVAGIDWWLVAFCVGTLDLCLALFMVWNFDLSKKIPILGRWIVRFEKGGKDVLKQHRWIDKLAYVGVALFVAVPFEGSGGLAASILGRVIGLNRYRVLVAVAAGSYTSSFLIALFADEFLRLFTVKVTTGITVIAIVIVVVAIYNLWKKARKQKI